MTRTLRAAVVSTGLMVAAPALGIAQPPPSPAPVAPAAPPPQQIIVPVDSQSAQQVREQLNELLRNYPPSVSQVLRLDPSLLTREGYLAPYPLLRAYIAQHPEIALQPSYYLGPPNFNQNQSDDTPSRIMRAFVEMTGFVTVLLGVVAFFALVGWLVRLVVDHRRWLKVMKTQTDVHAKLFDRLTSNEELLAYIQTPAGQRFLQSAPVTLDTTPRPSSAPVNRILWSVQAGTVLAVLGLGLWVAKNNIVDEIAGPLFVIAVLLIALGAGFALSAAVAYLLSLRLGLLEQSKP